MPESGREEASVRWVVVEIVGTYTDKKYAEAEAKKRGPGAHVMPAGFVAR